MTTLPSFELALAPHSGAIDPAGIAALAGLAIGLAMSFAIIWLAYVNRDAGA